MCNASIMIVSVQILGSSVVNFLNKNFLLFQCPAMTKYYEAGEHLELK